MHRARQEYAIRASRTRNTLFQHFGAQCLAAACTRGLWRMVNIPALPSDAVCRAVIYAKRYYYYHRALIHSPPESTTKGISVKVVVVVRDAVGFHALFTVMLSFCHPRGGSYLHTGSLNFFVWFIIFKSYSSSGVLSRVG